MRSRIHQRAAVTLCFVSVVSAGCGDEPTQPEATAEQSEASDSSSSTPDDKPSPTRDLDKFAAQVERASKSMLGGSLKKLYSSFRIEPDPPSGLEYIYVFKQPVDVARARQAMKAQLPVLRASFRTQIAPGMKRHGFKDPTATWTYLNPDGSEVFSRTFS
jgi:hypothetical protein